MTSKQASQNWTEEHQKAFELMKKFISRETLIVYHTFSKPFVAHTDASKVQELSKIMNEQFNVIEN